MSVKAAGIRGLSDRIGPQIGVTAAAGVALADVLPRAAYTEDVDDLRVTVYNTGAFPLHVGLKANDFSPTQDETTETHWEAIAVAEFVAAIVPGGSATAVIHDFERKYTKLRAYGEGGDTTFDVAFVGD